ncbi:MAG: signal peptidase I [Schleiferiaceae bacterium]|nr:signal peptidase I [Schleiferiaceae bacterium]
MEAIISSYWTYFLALQVIGFLSTVTFFKAAGKPVWAAAVPVYRTLVLLKLVDRSPWWVILTFLPVINNVVAIVLAYELLHVFNFRKTVQTFFVVATFGLYLVYLGFTGAPTYVGKDREFMKKQLGETVTSIFFAVIVATILRTFSFEAYTIPTSSMEKSLMVGDFLFVSKFHYGIRLPQTPLSIPLLHNKIPFTELPTFSRVVSLPYWRSPKIHDVKRGESVVFNYPMEEHLPVDKRENYIKRCVGLPGDTLAVVERQVYNNGIPMEFRYRANPMYWHYVETEGFPLNPLKVKEQFDINYLNQEQRLRNGDMGDVNAGEYYSDQGKGFYLVAISDSAIGDFEKLQQVTKVIPVNALPKGISYPEDTPPGLLNWYLENTNSGAFFPNPQSAHGEDTLVFRYTADNFGPIYIPKAGDKIVMNYENFMRYGRAIRVYEGNDISLNPDKTVSINGQLATDYTFKMNYYWMMGDNRHNSLDSRFWGFVPEDHIVGKPVFIWMSYDKYAKKFGDRIRWERVFTTVHFDGPRRSYFIPFIILVVLGTVLNSKWKKKKANASK